ncbi:MAG TPA: ROK family transcriptional regulator [Bacillales bacterium]|nr:ROK family transcriptional regulator [Bacillales bacterium]
MNSRSGLLKKINERKIFNAIYESEIISRAELARKLDLALPTVSRIVDDLLERGWLQSVGIGDSSGGRPPSLVKIDPEGAGVIGVDLGRESVRIIYADLLAQVRLAEDHPITDIEGPEELANHLKEFIKNCGIPKKRLLGIGIASPGPLDPDSGTLFSPEDVLANWLGAPIVETLESKIGVNTWLANDADAAALAENWFGRGKRIKSTLFVLHDVGIGSGIVLDGSIWRGTRNMAGEISHMVVNLEGEKCFCGKNGCVDTYASLYKIEQKIKGLRERKPDEAFLEILQRAKAKYEPDYSVIAKAARYVATAIINVVQAIDIEAVILGGRTLLYEDAYFSTLVENEVKQMLGSDNREISVTSFGFDAVSIGAATLVLQRIYDHTQLFY